MEPNKEVVMLVTMDSVEAHTVVSRLIELKSIDLKMKSEISGISWVKNNKESETLNNNFREDQPNKLLEML